MDFARPQWFWLLIPWLLLAFGLAVRTRRRRAVWSLLGQGGRPNGDGFVSGLIALALLIIALAQPRFGRDRAQAIPPGRDIVLLMDVSRSMAAEDAVPNRLGVAVEAASSLVSAMATEPGDRAAVVAFAGVGVVRCGLTENLGAVLDVLARLRPGAVQPGGTDLATALDAALATFDDHDHDDGRMIVIFTDGEDHGGAWMSRLKTLKQRGIIVNAVAIGDADKAQPVPGLVGVHMFDGKPVTSKRDDSALDAMAAATDGVVVKLGLAAADLGTLYREKIAPAAGHVREGQLPPDRAHRYALFVISALVLVSFRGTIRPPGRAKSRTGLAAALGLMLMMGGAKPPEMTPKSLIDRGQAAYRAKDYATALHSFERAAELATRSSVARFNAAATLFTLGKFPESIEFYQQAHALGDSALKLKADFGLGNAYLMSGDARTAILHYDNCLTSPAQSPTLSSTREDARINRDYALKRLREQDRDKPNSQPQPQPKKPDDTPENPNTKPNPGSNSNPVGTPSKSIPPDDASPTEQLDRALENVRQALKNRPPDPLPPPAHPSRKDW